MHSPGKPEWFLRLTMFLVESMAYAWADVGSDSSPASQINTTGVHMDCPSGYSSYSISAIYSLGTKTTAAGLILASSSKKLLHPILPPTLHVVEASPWAIIAHISPGGCWGRHSYLTRCFATELSHICSQLLWRPDRKNPNLSIFLFKRKVRDLVVYSST